jgi:membrane protein DedA with SNARE-associated domain
LASDASRTQAGRGSALQHLIEVVRPYFESWGYVIVFGTTVLENSAFLALIIPGDVVLLLAGFYAQRGALSLPAVMAIAFAGAVAGDTIAYVVGRFAGRRIVDRWGGNRLLPHSRLERFDRYFAEYGMWAVALGRITPVVRAFNTFAAGMSRMPFLRFLAAIVMTVAVWSTVVPSVGYLFSGSLDVARKYLGWGGAVLSIAFVVVLITTYRRMVKRFEETLESRATSGDG